MTPPRRLAMGGAMLAIAAAAVITGMELAAGRAAATPSAPRVEVAARFGELTVSSAELDARWRDRSPAAYAAAMQAVYDGRLTELRGLVTERMLADGAKARGLSPEAFEQREVAPQVSPVSPHDVQAFYLSNQDQLAGRSFEELEDPIRQLLERRAHDRARESVIAGLRRTAPPLHVLLDAPRLPALAAEGDPSIGPADAPVTIIEFADFQCPFCASVEPTLKQLRDTYGERMRIVWKDYPLTSIHPDAFNAAEASYCAGDQDKYWSYRERLFANQRALSPSQLRDHAVAVGLDVRRFDDCLRSSRHAVRVQNNLDAGARLGVESTPTLFVNGRVLSGSQPFEVFAAIVDDELNRARAKR